MRRVRRRGAARRAVRWGAWWLWLVVGAAIIGGFAVCRWLLLLR